MCSWSPMKWLSSSMNRLVLWPTGVLKTPVTLLTGKDLGSAPVQLGAEREEVVPGGQLRGDLSGSLGRPALSNRSAR